MRKAKQMGWYYEAGSRKQLIRNLTKEENWERNGVKVARKTLKHCYRGGAFSGVLWSIVEYIREEAGKVTTERIICCDLIQYYKSVYSPWGYKPMDETVGPYHYSCPLSYLELAPYTPDKGESARTWREKVVEHYKNKGKVLDNKRISLIMGS